MYLHNSSFAVFSLSTVSFIQILMSRHGSNALMVPLKLIFSERFTHWYLVSSGRTGGLTKLQYFASGKWLNFAILYFQVGNVERRKISKRLQRKTSSPTAAGAKQDWIRVATLPEYMQSSIAEPCNCFWMFDNWKR